MFHNTENGTHCFLFIVHIIGKFDNARVHNKLTKHHSWFCLLTKKAAAAAELKLRVNWQTRQES